MLVVVFVIVLSLSKAVSTIAARLSAIIILAEIFPFLDLLVLLVTRLALVLRVLLDVRGPTLAGDALKRLLAGGVLVSVL